MEPSCRARNSAELCHQQSRWSLDRARILISRSGGTPLRTRKVGSIRSSARIQRRARWAAGGSRCRLDRGRTHSWANLADILKSRSSLAERTHVEWHRTASERASFPLSRGEYSVRRRKPPAHGDPVKAIRSTGLLAFHSDPTSRRQSPITFDVTTDQAFPCCEPVFRIQLLRAR